MNRRSRHSRTTPLSAPFQAKRVCLEVRDHSVSYWSAVEFFRLQSARDPHAQAARLAEQFEAQNRVLMSLLDVRLIREYDGNDVKLSIQAGSAVGAVPLISPSSAQMDYGLVVQPRFPWKGIGPMLAEMGWRVSPIPLPLPLLHRSERRVPIWVLSFMILTRLNALLDSLNRRFEIVNEIRRAPRGHVHWNMQSKVCHMRSCCQYLARFQTFAMTGCFRAPFDTAPSASFVPLRRRKNMGHSFIGLWTLPNAYSDACSTFLPIALLRQHSEFGCRDLCAPIVSSKAYKRLNGP